MSELPDGEPVEEIENLDEADMRDRLEKEPEEWRNREEMPDEDERAAGPNSPKKS